MKRQEALPELLAPAGSMEALYAAVAGGADAVYVGGRSFSARANAKNFDVDELRRGVEYCHLSGVRLYVTVNTLLYDRELDEAVSFCRALDEMGVDAVIIADVGLMRRLRREVPHLILHASTQLSVHSTEGVRRAVELGASRVVAARELSQAAIAQLVQEGDAEVEMFLHGALCVCHSGQCLFSSLVGGRSGNRGGCAQPCRLPYNGGYPLSLQDLCLAAHIPQLILSGVASLKIEGRMKAPAYVYGVTKIYRRLLDEGRCATEEEMAYLARLFSRSGFTDGYYTGAVHRPMTGVRTEADKTDSRREQGMSFAPQKFRVKGFLQVLSGEKCKLTFTYRGLQATVYGDVPAPAKSAGLTEDTLRRAMGKLGDTDLVLDDGFEIRSEEGLFLPMGALNALRRAGTEALYRGLHKPLPCATEVRRVDRSFSREASLAEVPSLRTAVFYDADAYLAAMEKAFFDICFLPLFAWEGRAVPQGVFLPPVVTDAERCRVLAQMNKAKACGVRYALCGNIGQLELCRESGLVAIGDFRFNITNRAAAEAWDEMGLAGYVLSPELTLPQLRDIGRGLVPVYGRIPLMITERCFVKENGGCKRCGSFSLRDRTGASFPIRREFDHRNIIFNSLPTYMGDRQQELDRAGICREHFIFSTESGREIDRVVEAYRAGAPLVGTRRIPTKNGM